MHHLTDAGLALLTRTTATLHVLGARLHDDRDRERGDVPGWVMITLMTAGLVAALALGAAMKWDSAQQAKREVPEVPPEIDPYAGGYPVPPMPGQRLLEPRRDHALTGTIRSSEPVRPDAGSDPTPDATMQEEGHRG